MFQLRHLQTTNNQNLRELDDFDDSLELSEEGHHRIQEYVDLLNRSRTLLEILCEALGVEGTGTYLHRNSVQPWDLLNDPNNFVTTTLFTHIAQRIDDSLPPDLQFATLHQEAQLHQLHQNHDESRFRLESELEPLDEETFKKPSQTQTGLSAPGERRITKDGTYLKPTDSKYILDTDSLPELLRLTNISSHTDSTLLQTDSHYLSFERAILRSLIHEQVPDLPVELSPVPSIRFFKDDPFTYTESPPDLRPWKKPLSLHLTQLLRSVNRVKEGRVQKKKKY